MTKEQAFACMGPPANKGVEGATEVWSYPSGNGNDRRDLRQWRYDGDQFAFVKQWNGSARMINMGIVISAGIFYFTGQYGLALLLIVLSIINGAGAAVMAIVNPDWYFERRMRAGFDVDIFNPSKGIASLLVTKVIAIAILAWIAWYIAEKAGYI